ncbi:MAG: GDP-mannose 4,6-dehydratase [Bacteroidetes bacterium]|nr:GDP-mannose 4,6-dehydratase [Bacteroidota bacterium]MBU1720912.1 GDP-mannose 4,6-dehydratase [Bacteroidota bacterium]
MKVIITGAAGFIGSNLASRLVASNFDVIGIDNLTYGNLRNIDHLKGNPKFNFVFGDITNPFILNTYHADVIVHLASQKIPRYSNALRTLDENNLMLRNIVRKCVSDQSRMLFASTSDVYGKNPNVPFNEESDLVMGPTKIKRWAYALSKIFAEQYIIGCNDEYGINYTIMRFFGSYGINQNLTWWGGPQSVFIGKALKREPMEIHGDGQQTRTFTYVDDTVEGIFRCITNESAINEIFNIGTEASAEISISDLAALIWNLIHPDEEPMLTFIPYESFGRYEDVMRRVPDIEKIKSKLGYQPVVSLNNGLKRTIEWQKQIPAE